MLRIGVPWLPRINEVTACSRASFSTTKSVQELRKLTRVNIVDNSSIAAQVAATGKPARVIHVYNKIGYARIGDQVLLAAAGQKVKGYVVGVRKKQRPMVPTFDSNNVVLVDDTGMPLGTRIQAPVPTILRYRGGDFTKLMALANRFV